MLKITLNNGSTFTDILEIEFIKNGTEISALTDDYDTIQIFTVKCGKPTPLGVGWIARF